MDLTIFGIVLAILLFLLSLYSERVRGLVERPFREAWAWWNSGRLDIKFTNPVWLDDTVVARGVELGQTKNDTGRTAAFVWLAKPDETVVLVANASIESLD